MDTGAEVKSLTEHTNSVTSVYFSPNATKTAAASAEAANLFADRGDVPALSVGAPPATMLLDICRVPAFAATGCVGAASVLDNPNLARVLQQRCGL